MTLTPPFRADIVGSFLRPAPVKAAREQLAEGTIDVEALSAVEDASLVDLVEAQAAAGLQVATDGELRRSWWHFDFFGMLDGVEIFETDHSLPFRGATTKPHAIRIDGRIGFPANHPMVGHFTALAAVAEEKGLTPKASIPSPTVLDFRVEEPNIVTDAYAARADYVDDLVQTYRDAIAAYYAAGCRYLQFDDTAWAYLCSETELERARTERGIDTEGLGARYADILRRVLEGKPEDLVVTTHVCRGNFRSTWISSGGYEPVAEHLLAIPYDGFFLEYDSERAGGFEPLRFLQPGHQRVVLGLVTSKSGELEPKEEILARISEATRFAPLEQLALSPQCGFASTEEGNVLTEDEQWAKVRHVVDIAGEVWGES
ncbi:5-methyltetrahydropteroyltriglutamate--homocysteine S-methyltransferase [Brevibacterium samyangense]|uniref:Cobalamin-independent methionine synthase II family protein n=1 Tax=Brevibacterium samyangense TaxID=366888 RepID=A0ABP5ENY1_9MICO